MKKETLSTIAHRTGFSISTISRVLSGKAEQYRICDSTVKAIKEEARKCHYSPDVVARSLRTRRTYTIGLLVPEIQNPFFANISSIVIQRAKEKGYNIIVADSMEKEENEIQAIRDFISRKVDGIIIVPVGQNPSYLEEINKFTPIILIDRYYNNTDLQYVGSDNFAGAYMATEHLVSKGYRNIMVIQGVNVSTTNQERVRGHLAALKKFGTAQTKIDGESFSIENGYKVAKQAIESDPAPDAIFAFSNTIMLGALKAIKEAGKNIPQDIALISFDNNNYLDYLDPPVTRIAQPIEKIGQIATDRLIKRISGKSSASEEELCHRITPYLIVGKSC